MGPGSVSHYVEGSDGDFYTVCYDGACYIVFCDRVRYTVLCVGVC